MSHAVLPRILLVDDEQGILDVLETLFEDDYDMVCASSGHEAIELFEARAFDVVLLDVDMPDINGIDVLRHIKNRDPAVDVVMVSALDKTAPTRESLMTGAADYVNKPFNNAKLLELVQEILDRRRIRNTLCSSAPSSSSISCPEIVCRSSAMGDVLKCIQQVAYTDSTVLITGESGTGKELAARAIHSQSLRRDKRFVAVNCALFQEQLIESELFGHEKGAFTGAHSKTIGKFEYADGGTLFLDEIASLNPSVQAHLLRALQEKEIRRVGSNDVIHVDVRVVCASNRDLSELVKSGEFREDLYYRLNVVPIALPPLRKRTGDAALLAEYFLLRICERQGKSIPGFTADALAAIESYPWPGNVRELQNIVERLVVFGEPGKAIATNDMLFDHFHSSPLAGQPSASDTVGLVDACQRFERNLVVEALRKHHGKKMKAAASLGIHRNTLTKKIFAHGLREEDWRTDSPE